MKNFIKHEVIDDSLLPSIFGGTETVALSSGDVNTICNALGAAVQIATPANLNEQYFSNN